MPVHTTRRLYEDSTLEVIETLIGGRAYDQASDPIARQIIDPDAWRSMRKGPLSLFESAKNGPAWALARALAYDRCLPATVLPRARRMLQATHIRSAIELVYFPDAVGIMHRHTGHPTFDDPLRAAQARICLVTRDIACPEDLLRRNDVFRKTMWRWLDHLHAESMCCAGLTLPRIEHLQRTTTAKPPPRARSTD